jgi:hypothetical protein
MAAKAAYPSSYPYSSVHTDVDVEKALGDGEADHQDGMHRAMRLGFVRCVVVFVRVAMGDHWCCFLLTCCVVGLVCWWNINTAAAWVLPSEQSTATTCSTPSFMYS